MGKEFGKKKLFIWASVFFMALAALVFAATIDSITLYSPGNNTITNDTTPTFNFSVSGSETNYSYELYVCNESYSLFTFNSSGDIIGTEANSNSCNGCDSGFVGVPGDSDFGTSDFCVMKYEAKDVGDVATSQADLGPWVSISQTSAIAKCSAIGAHLCTVNETQTINRNIEQVAGNWQGGTVGSGCMFGGHMDNHPASALAGSTDDDPYYGTTDSAAEAVVCPFDITDGGKASRRTMNLSNGGIIWDWSGNVWEWIYGEGASGTVGSGWYGTAGWIDWNNANLDDPERGRLGPSNSSWTSSNGMGQYYGGISTNAVLRGGYWTDGASAGPFCARLVNAPTTTSTNIGFRCCSS